MSDYLKHVRLYESEWDKCLKRKRHFSCDRWIQRLVSIKAATIATLMNHTQLFINHNYFSLANFKITKIPLLHLSPLLQPRPLLTCPRCCYVGSVLKSRHELKIPYSSRVSSTIDRQNYESLYVNGHDSKSERHVAVTGTRKLMSISLSGPHLDAYK